MLYRSFYYIKPKEGLLNIALSFDEESRDILLRGQLWESEEGGKTTASPQDYMDRAKLAFLINLQTENVGFWGVESLFKGKKISLSFFAQYWEIESLAFAGNVREISDGSLPRSDVEMTGRGMLDAWLERKTSR